MIERIGSGRCETDSHPIGAAWTSLSAPSSRDPARTPAEWRRRGGSGEPLEIGWGRGAIVVTEPGGPDVLQWQEVARPGRRRRARCWSTSRRRPSTGPTSCSGRGTTRRRRARRRTRASSAPGRIAALAPGVDGLVRRRRGVCPAVRRRLRRAGRGARPGSCCRCPTGVDLVDAAGLPEVACTVWSNVFMVAGLRPGETLLVHGGRPASARWRSSSPSRSGARVAVTAGPPEKLERCRELGAEILVNYRDEDFVEAVRAATDGHGADVVLDNMGAKYLARNLDVLAFNGRLVVIGMQGGTKAELDIGLLMRKRAALLSTSLRARPAAEKAAIVASVREHVWPLIEAGEVRPVIDRGAADGRRGRGAPRRRGRASTSARCCSRPRTPAAGSEARGISR